MPDELVSELISNIRLLPCIGWSASVPPRRYQKRKGISQIDSLVSLTGRTAGFIGRGTVACRVRGPLLLRTERTGPRRNVDYIRTRRPLHDFFLPKQCTVCITARPSVELSG